MLIKDIINKISGFRYIIDNLDIKSGLGRKYLLSQKFITSENDLIKEINNIEIFTNYIEKNNIDIEKIKVKLENIKDINGTVNNLNNDLVLDDIELFEIKHLCILSIEISNIIENNKIIEIDNNALAKIISILDPDNENIPRFYIYSSYDNELKNLREKIKSSNQEQAEIYRLKSIEIEDKIRQNLSKKLTSYKDVLLKTLIEIGYLDLLLAKYIQNKQYNLIKPLISKDKTEYKQIFNPLISNELNSKNKKIQKIDISLENNPCLITGANMAGKTVLLKTLALCQYMFQFGFYVPADKAKIAIVDEVFISIEDKQSELNGLSSFAAEMLNINKLLKSVNNNKKILAVIDELARTTNPKEGRAIVSALIDILTENNIKSIITTHYSEIKANCRHLRVKGIQKEKIYEDITIENINNYMDYSLIEIKTNDVPLEALEIANILKIDKNLINLAKKYL